MLDTTGPSPARKVCTWVSVTLNGATTLMTGAAVSVDPVTATLPVAPVRVHSGVPALVGAAVGQAPAAVAVSLAEQPANVATKAALLRSARDELIRERFTVVTVQPLSMSLRTGRRRAADPTDTGLLSHLLGYKVPS